MPKNSEDAVEEFRPYFDHAPVYGYGPSLEEFTRQTPLTVGSPEQVIDRTLTFRETFGDYQRIKEFSGCGWHHRGGVGRTEPTVLDTSACAAIGDVRGRAERRGGRRCRPRRPAGVGAVHHNNLVRPLMSYLRARPVPTAVFAAGADFGSDAAGASLSSRISRAAAELLALLDATQATAKRDPFDLPFAFEEMLQER